jgi:hypothetical protein
LEKIAGRTKSTDEKKNLAAIFKNNLQSYIL